MKQISYYQCELCKATYATPELALLCEAQQVEPCAQPGDIVTARGGFGWFDGDVSWVSNPDVSAKAKPLRPCPNGDSNCFSACCTYSFYYVVGAVALDEVETTFVRDLGRTGVVRHRIKYHLFTRAMSGKQGYAEGYTFDVHHITPKRVEPQPVLPGAELFLGRTTTRLM